jgi:polar amino acid transport system substrate-binding protein
LRPIKPHCKVRAKRCTPAGDAPGNQSRDLIRESVMSFAKFTVAAAAAFIGLGMAASQAEGLPDLGGQTVVVVTENAYPPLQFIDPKTGDQIGWEYDAMNEIAKRLNFTVEYQNTSWDAMIQSVSDGQY